MILDRTLATVSACAMALSLTACGDGGGPTSLVSAPPPTVAPPAVPPPTPTPKQLTAPLPASTPALPAFPQAVAGGPTIAAPGSAVLPLLQTVMKSDSSGTAPDLATMNGGATLVLSSDPYKATFNIANSAIGVTNAALTRTSGTVFVETSGSTVVRLQLAALDWTAYGMWLAYPGGNNPTTAEHAAQFVTGFETPGGAVPTSGSATYSGATFGYVFRDGGLADVLTGTANLQANFSNGTITGTLTDMVLGDPWYAGAYPWNSVSLSASFAGGQSRFAGTTAVTSAPGNFGSLKAGATGTIAGSFFGPNAQEVGAVWTLFDGTTAATGSIGARRGP